METNLNRIDFSPTSQNLLLLNPKLSQVELDTLHDLKLKFDQEVKKEGYFLIASSGSSQSITESVKLIAISKNAILNSAKRFNNFFNVQPNDVWGLCLPFFHVAGLSVYARAFLAKQKIVNFDWQLKSLDQFFSDNSIQYISLVPAMIYDLVNRQIKAPADIKKVFVGAGALSEKLRNKVHCLGWPIVETYGMTETGSMIAVKENSNLFEVLPSVQVKTKNDHLIINCDSCAEYSLQKINDSTSIKFLLNENWYETSDLVSILEKQGKKYIQYLGRNTDYIKILGEGVSLLELREKMSSLSSELKISSDNLYLFTIEDERKQNKLVLAYEEVVTFETIQKLINKFNTCVRPYEKIQDSLQLDLIKKTELGKVKFNEIKELYLKNEMRKNDKKI